MSSWSRAATGLLRFIQLAKASQRLSIGTLPVKPLRSAAHPSLIAATCSVVLRDTWAQVSNALQYSSTSMVRRKQASPKVSR
jgi:hypothetical protein